MRNAGFWGSVTRAAEDEAWASPLPGWGDGPADAYRHLVLAAELRRRFGWTIALWPSDRQRDRRDRVRELVAIDGHG